MPFRRSDYHPKWELIRLLILRRANHACEQCGVKNHSIIRRLLGGRFVYATGCDLLEIAYLRTHKKPTGRYYTRWQALRHLHLTRVILTTAHLDRNPKNNRFWNLKCLCQRCHLLHDMPQHVRNRNYGRDHDREHQVKVFTPQS